MRWTFPPPRTGAMWTTASTATSATRRARETRASGTFRGLPRIPRAQNSTASSSPSTSSASTASLITWEARWCASHETAAPLDRSAAQVLRDAREEPQSRQLPCLLRALPGIRACLPPECGGALGAPARGAVCSGNRAAAALPERHARAVREDGARPAVLDQGAGGAIARLAAGAHLHL